MDFSSVETMATPKKIIKWKDKGKLEVKCPSGIWANAKKCPEEYLERLLSKEQFWMFRKQLS